MKNLLERYLQAVGRYLPAKSKDDTLAELRTNLQAQMEDRSEALGRPLTEAEEAELLRGHGHPSVVAVRYRPGRQLIGPEIFPYYWTTLTKVLPFIVLIAVVSCAAHAVFGPPQAHVIATSVESVFSTLFYFVVWITVFFVAVDFFHARYPAKVTIYAQWDPLKLPEVETKDREGLAKYPVADLILSALFTVWLLAFPRYPYLLFGPGAWYISSLSIELAPVWHRFYWAVVALNVMQLVFKGILLIWNVKPWRRVMKLVEQVFGFCLLLLLLQAQSYVVYLSPVADPARVRFAETLNHGVHQSLELVAVIVGLKLIWSIWQMVRDSGSPRMAGVVL